MFYRVSNILRRMTDRAQWKRERYGPGVKSNTPEYWRAYQREHKDRVQWRNRASARRRREKARELSTLAAENARLKALLEAKSDASPLPELIAALELSVNPLTPPEKKRGTVSKTSVDSS